MEKSKINSRATVIDLLPVNSSELDQQLSDFGVSLLKFAKAYDFSKKCLGVDDCDFIQSTIITFFASLKTDFIAFHAVSNASAAGHTEIIVNGAHHTQKVLMEAAIHAGQFGMKVRHPHFSTVARLRHAFADLLSSVKHRLYDWRMRRRDRKIKTMAVPMPGEGQFRLLLSTFHPNTVFTLTPIQDYLKARPEVFQLYIANRFETYNRLTGLGYDNILYGWNLPTRTKLRMNEDVLADFVKRFFAQYTPWSKVSKRFQSRFYEKLKNELQFAAALYMPVKQIMLDYKPEAILLSSCSTTDAQLMIHIAESMNIKVIEMTHGMFQDTPTLKFQNVPVKLVWNEMQREIMQKYKPSISCPVIGNPKHDELLARFKNKPPQRHYENPYVLLISSPGRNTSLSWATYLKVLQEYIHVAHQFPDLDFVLKLHPSENKKTIQDAVKNFGGGSNFIIEKDKNVYELLYHAEIVVVITSSVGFEALLWDKKIICYSVPNSDKWLPFAQRNLAKAAHSADELAEAIRYFLQNESLTIDNSNKDYFAYTDGKALHKVVNFLLKEQLPAT